MTSNGVFDKLINFSPILTGTIPIEIDTDKSDIVEDRIIWQKGNPFKQQITELKKKGIKTEPTSGILLGFAKNPYEELLNYVNN